MSEMGREIRRLREEKGWTQAALAVYSGMDPSSINLIERGQRNASTRSVQKIADALGVGVGDLFAPKGQSPLPLEDGTHYTRTSRGWTGRMTGSSHAEMRPILEAVASGEKTPAEAEREILALVGAA
jgi:transcriptional regulator with XRE-family HTH domain